MHDYTQVNGADTANSADDELEVAGELEEFGLRRL